MNAWCIKIPCDSLDTFTVVLLYRAPPGFTLLLTDGWYCFCLSCDYIGTQPFSAFQNIPCLRKVLSAGQTKWKQENMWDHPPSTNSFTFSRLIRIVTSTFCTSEYRSCNNVYADLFPISTVPVRVSLQHFSKTMFSV